MVLSVVQVESPMALIRAAAWSNSLARMGLHLPLFIVHDLGALLSVPRGAGGFSVRMRESQLSRVPLQPPARTALEQYHRMIEHVAASDVAERLAGLRLRDELIAVLLSRILTDAYNRWRERAKSTVMEVLPLDLSIYADVDFADHWRDFDSRPLLGFLEHVVGQAMHVYTQVELTDVDTVRLLGLFNDNLTGGSDGGGGAVDLVDLFAALGSPEAHDVANFSLELLPSVLETRRASGVQTFAVDGYASIERKGNVDSLVLSELAYDREIFEQKVVDSELLYYGRDRERDDERRLQYVLIDSSASMRGQRQVFARGLALTLAKKLLLEGDEVWMRFFDSRLHELIKVSRSGQVPVPYLLSFRSERGRNYGKVFAQLLTEVQRVKRDHARRVVIYIITHGQCHISPEVITALKQYAFLYGIVIQPSSDELPEFVSVLDRHQVVTLDSFRSRAGRQRRALDIVRDTRAARGAK